MRHANRITKAMQQTVMSPARWFSMDHLPGSCLLLILRRSPNVQRAMP
jgi:hypothetical protein